MIRKAFLWIVLLGSFQLVTAQPEKFWLDLGYGVFAAFDGVDGFTSIANQKDEQVYPGYFCLSLMDGKNVYKARFLSSEEWAFWGDDQPEEVYHHAGLLLGYGLGGNLIQIQFSGGLGLTWGQERGNFLYNTGGWFSHDVYEEEHFLAFSIPVQVDLVLVPVRFAGVGATAFADINFNNPYVGLAFKLSVGKLRKE